MPVLITSQFDEDLIENERASLEKPFPHYKSMGIFSNAQRHLTLSGVGRSGLNSNSSKILCLSLSPANSKKILSQQRKGGDIVSPVISQKAISVAMETRVFIQSVPKPYAAFPLP